MFIIILLGKFLRPRFYAEPHFICNRISSFCKAKLLTVIIDMDIVIVVVVVVIIIIIIRGVFN